MTKRKRTRKSTEPSLTDAQTTASARPKASVFISHDTRDADIAEAFSNLLRDASGGILKSFRSSDRKGTSGIEFGAEWYGTIMERLNDATDVVALLTPNSIDRPWLLYEAGVAKGKLETVVFGIAIGVPLEKASVGPFAQFQNSADDEESITSLVLQLIRRNPDADPREEAVHRQVVAFKQTTADIVSKRAKSTQPASSTELDATAVAKLFEEVKVMFRQLPQQVEATVEHNLRRRTSMKRRSVHPRLLEDLMSRVRHGVSENNPEVWLTISSYVRDDVPWLYDLLLELYRAQIRGDTQAVKESYQTILRMMDSKEYDILIHESLSRNEDRGLAILLHELRPMIKYLLRQAPHRASSRKPLKKKTRSKSSAG